MFNEPDFSKTILALLTLFNASFAYANSDKFKKSQGDDIVVLGNKENTPLENGIWELKLSKSTFFGDIFDRPWEGTPLNQNAQPTLKDWEKIRPTGLERVWKFCLISVDFKPLLKGIVKSGSTESSSTNNCGRLSINIDKGIIRANQECSGVSEFVENNSNPNGTSTSEIPIGNGRVISMKDSLAISGHYDPKTFTVDFRDSRQPVFYDPKYSMHPYGRQWNLTGKKIGICS